MSFETFNKILGYFLVTSGVFIIIFSTWKVYTVFTGQSQPYNLFSLQPIVLDLGKIANLEGNSSLEHQLIDSDALNKPLNYVAYIILMGFIASTGFRIASIGVYLVRTIKVSIRNEKNSLE